MTDQPVESRRFHAPPVLRTARLVCERFTIAHTEELGVMDRDQAVQVWLFGKTYTPQETRARAKRRVAYWKEWGAGDYLVRPAAGGGFVGFAGFFPSDRPGAIAIGYALRPEYWGRGYGTELARELTRTAAGFGCAEIVATVLPSNAASRSVLEKTGFVAAGPAHEGEETLLYRYAGSP
jgi:RimJ/RimL family protein N-acetyltransferase